MKKRYFTLALSAVALSMVAETVTIKGKVELGLMQSVDIYVAKSGEQATPVDMPVPHDFYSAKIDIDAPEFCYIIGLSTDSMSNRSQIYTPVYLSPSNPVVEIDIVNNGAKVKFVSNDHDQTILMDYYQDFLAKNFSKIPQPGTEAEFLNRITNYVDSVATTANNEIVADYMRLRGYLDRESAMTQMRRYYKNQGLSFPENANADSKPAKEMMSNKAVPHLLKEFSSIVLSKVIKGRNVVERMTSIKNDVKNPELANAVENLIVSRFISGYDYNNGIENGVDTLKMIASHRPDYQQLEQEFKMKAYSAPGAPLPDVAVYDVAGNAHKLSEFKGKYIYVDFWASWCGPCNREIPFMKELEKTLGNDMVVFVGISIDEDSEAWKNALTRHGLHHNQFIGTDELAKMLNVQSIPRYVIYDKDGKLLNPNAPRPSSGDELRQLLLQLK